MCNRCDKEQSTGKIIFWTKLKLGRVQQVPFSVWLVFKWEIIIFLPIIGIVIMQIKWYFHSNEIKELLDCICLCLIYIYCFSWNVLCKSSGSAMWEIQHISIAKSLKKWKPSEANPNCSVKGSPVTNGTCCSLTLPDFTFPISPFSTDTLAIE